MILARWDMKVGACWVARTRVGRMLEESVAGVFVVSRCAVVTGECAYLVVFVLRLLWHCGFGPFG